MSNRVTEINLVFSTPVWTSIVPKYEEINEKMLTYINELKSNNPEGKIRSNIVGWHSKNFDLKLPEPNFFINSISPILNEAINDMGWDLEKNKPEITSMWTIINPTNASNSRHIHSNNFISAAYYIKAPANCGSISFYDPRSANVIRTPKISNYNKLNSDIFSIEPKEGLLVLFPSYLHHSVAMNLADDDRIVLSFNVNL